MSRYKVGDVVRIVPESVIQSFDRSHGNGFRSPEALFIAPEMLEYCETYVLIIGVTPGGNYKVLENGWTWSESCFEQPYDFSGMEDLL